MDQVSNDFLSHPVICKALGYKNRQPDRYDEEGVTYIRLVTLAYKTL